MVMMLAWGARGRRFKSCRSHHYQQPYAGAEYAYIGPPPPGRMGLRNRLKKYCVMKKVRESADEDGGADGR